MRFAPLAMLAAGSFAALAAASTTVSINFDPYASDEASVGIDFGSAEGSQYVYSRDSVNDAAKLVATGTSRIGSFVDSYRLPNGNDAFDGTGAKITADSGEKYLLLSFDFDGVRQAGTASFSGYTLSEITYDVAPSTVPEPAVWAQLISGFGLAGSALRVGRRRRRTVNA